MAESDGEVAPKPAVGKNRRRSPEHQWDSAFKRYVMATVVGIGVIFTAAILIHQVYYAITSGLISRTANVQFAAFFCVPIAYVSALVLVLVLRVATGPVEFKFLGLEFRGSSGPLVFWILCFLSIVWAFKTMWIWKQ
jgi:hypothetical protein